MANSAFKQKKVTVGGKEYTLQKIPFKHFLEINDRCTNKNGVLMKAPYSEALLKHIVVSPKVNLDSFDDDMGAGMELVGQAESFLLIKSDESTSETPGEGESDVLAADTGGRDSAE